MFFFNENIRSQALLVEALAKIVLLLFIADLDRLSRIVLFSSVFGYLKIVFVIDFKAYDLDGNINTVKFYFECQLFRGLASD